jgi:two-component sensor histidine kinase
MHPILAARERLALYLVAWAPLCAILVALLVASGQVRALEALAVAAPACTIYAFACLSAYYLCRALPLRPSPQWWLLLVAAAASACSAGIWMGLVGGLANFLDQAFHLSGLAANIWRQWPVVYGLGALYYLLSVAIHYLLITAAASAVTEKEAAQARSLATEAELKALKAQINPHFLFNSLNSVSALVTSNPAKAREMCVLLADFLRKSLSLADAAAIPLKEEMALVRNFLAIEQVRFGSRLQIEESIGDGCETLLVPTLLLQPLLENAVKHGIAHQLEGGTVRIEAHSNGARLHLAVENNIDPEWLSLSKKGFGLDLVRKRLATRYGQEATFEARQDAGSFRVEMSLPARASEKA